MNLYTTFFLTSALFLAACSGPVTKPEAPWPPPGNCDGGEGCFESGARTLLYGEPAPDTSKTDLSEAAADFVRSCNFGYDRGCNAAGKMFGDGLGVEKDVEKAKFYYDKACQEKLIEACHNLFMLNADLEKVMEQPDKPVEEKPEISEAVDNPT